MSNSTTGFRPRTRLVLVGAALSLTAVALTACSASESASAAPTSRSTEATATTVTVQGQKINVLCTGAVTSQPTIVLVAGEPDPLTKFTALQKTLSHKQQVCSYDRPGEGASPAPTTAQSLNDTATVLDGVLKAEHIHGKVIVVGHSLGGLIAANFAHQYPNRVAGVVLLDATAPSVPAAINALIPADATGAAAAVREEVGAFSTASTNPEKLVSDGKPLGSLGHIPLTVVQHGQPIYSQVLPEYGARLQSIWTTGQHQLAALSRDSTLVTAQSSGHYIYLDQPALTVHLIQDASNR